MRMRFRWAVVAFGFLIAGCGERRAARPAATGDTRAARDTSVDPATVIGQVALELWPLRDSLSLAEWNATRPEPVTRRTASTGDEDLGGWCVASERRVELAGHRLIRQAFFYPPLPPPALAPIAAESPERLLARECALGVIRVRVPVPDSLAGIALAESLRAQLSGINGHEIAGPDPLADSLLWDRGRWRRGPVTIVTGYRRPGPERDPAAPGGVVVALAFLPNADLGPASGRSERRGRLLEAVLADTLPLDSAVHLSAVDTALWSPLRRALPPPDGTGDSAFSAERRARLVEAYRRWLAAANAQPGGRRAAALFVADQVLSRVWDLVLCDNVLCRGMDTTRLRPWRAMGATFAHDAAADDWTYTHGWLAGILGLGLDGPVSNAAFVIMLARGFDATGRCPAGAEPFRAVIAKGEDWLARHPQHPYRRSVHFLVGEADRDIVALAHGAGAAGPGGAPADSARWLEQAPAALGKALEHYRLAVTPGDTSLVAREAWRRTWWLTAGLPPLETRFACRP